MADLNKDAVFTKRVADLDPAAALTTPDIFLVSQGGIARKATIVQIREGLATAIALTNHLSDASNPHFTTAAQVGAFTSQQTTSAIATAQTNVQNNLDAFAARRDNPNIVTALQVDAPTNAQSTSAIATAQTNVQNNLNTFAARRDNPNVVTAIQVGVNTPQWNANRIQSRNVIIPSAAADLGVLTYLSASNTIELRPTLSSLPPNPLGAVQFLPYAISSTELYTDLGNWLWYPARGQSIGKASSGANIPNDKLLQLFTVLWANVGSGGWLMKNSFNAIVAKGVSAIADWDGNRRLTPPDFGGRAVVASGQGPGLTLRKPGFDGGSESVVIAASNLPVIPFNRNDGGSSPNTPFSLVAKGNGAFYESPSANPAINVGSPNTPVDNMMPYKVYSEIWFTGVQA